MAFLIQQLTANGGTGSPETLGQVIAQKAIYDFITNDSVASISVNNGGAGYVQGETFDIVIPGSPGEIFRATGIVVKTNAETSPIGSPLGTVAEVKILSGGAYVDLYARGLSPEGQTLVGVSTTNASASGTGLTVDVVPEEAHWVADTGEGQTSPVLATDYQDDRTNWRFLATSKKASNPPTIGMRCSTSGGNPFFELLCATGFDKTAAWASQPGANNSNRTRIMCPGTDPQIYISSSERRVNIMIRSGNFVQYGVTGFFIPYTDTEANYPFPGIVAGQTPGVLNFSSSMVRSNGATPTTQNSGVINAMDLQTSTADQGPYEYRDNTSPQWLKICEDTNQLTTLDANMWPQLQDEAAYDYTDAPSVSGFSTLPTTDSYNGILTDDNGPLGWFQSDAGSGSGKGIQGVAPFGLQNRGSLVVQPHIIRNQTGDVQVIGIIDGYQAVHGIGLTAFQEIISFSGQRFIVFPDTNSGDLYRWVAMEII